MNVKVELGEYIFRLSALINSYGQLIQCITQKFQDLPQIFIIKYKDEENDWICVQSEEDFQILHKFYNEQSKNIIKLKVCLQLNGFYLNTLIQNSQQNQFQNQINTMQQQMQALIGNFAAQPKYQNQQLQENKGLDLGYLQKLSQNQQYEQQNFFQQQNSGEYQYQNLQTMKPQYNHNDFPQFHKKPSNNSQEYQNQMKNQEIKYSQDYLTKQPQIPHQQENIQQLDNGSVIVIKRHSDSQLQNNLQQYKKQHSVDIEAYCQKFQLTPFQQKVIEWVLSKLNQKTIEIECQSCKNQRINFENCDACHGTKKITFDKKISESIALSQITKQLPYFELEYEAHLKPQKEIEVSTAKPHQSQYKNVINFQDKTPQDYLDQNNDELIHDDFDEKNFQKYEVKQIIEDKQVLKENTKNPEYNSLSNFQDLTPQINNGTQDFSNKQNSDLKFHQNFTCSKCLREICKAKVKYDCQTCNIQICESCENKVESCIHGLVKLKPEHVQNNQQINKSQTKLKSSYLNNQNNTSENYGYFSKIDSQPIKSQVTQQPNQDLQQFLQNQKFQDEEEQKSQKSDSAEKAKEISNKIGNSIQLTSSQTSVNNSQSKCNQLELMAKIELGEKIEELTPKEKFFPILNITNTGTQKWENVYLRCIEGTYKGGQQIISGQIYPDQKVKTCLSLIAPKKPKQHISFWRMYKQAGDDKKDFFGPRFELKVQVGDQNPQNDLTQSNITPGQGEYDLIYSKQI